MGSGQAPAGSRPDLQAFASSNMPPADPAHRPPDNAAAMGGAAPMFEAQSPQGSYQTPGAVPPASSTPYTPAQPQVTPSVGMLSGPTWDAYAPAPPASSPNLPQAYPAQTPLPGQQAQASGEIFNFGAPVYGVPAQPVGQPSTPGQSSPQYPPVAQSYADQGVPGGAPAYGSPIPSGASYPGPTSGTYPEMVLGGVSQPGTGYGYPGQMTAPPPAMPPAPKSSPLIKPLPIWAFIPAVILGALLLVLLFFTGSDWAAGAQTAGIVAGILALLILIATGARVALGMADKINPKRRTQLISASLLVVLLLIISGVGLTQQATFHGLQGRYLEGQQQWQSAINQFQLAGENAPASDNIARTYVEWGEQYSKEQQYARAIDRYNVVLNTFGTAITEVNRAQADGVTAYLDWGNQASQQHDYAGATQHFDALLQLPYCNASCQAQANGFDATAYYNLAESQLSAQQYSDAVKNFGTVTSRFSNAPESQKSHPDYAKALMGLGQQQLTSNCSSAIPTYQQLSSQFSDTSQGQQAAQALKQPQPLKGHFTSTLPASPNVPMVAFMKGLTPTITTDQFYAIWNNSPKADVHADGTFASSPLPQGSYQLSWGEVNANGEDFYYSRTGVYTAQVGPLCAYDYGDLTDSFPPAP